MKRPSPFAQRSMGLFNTSSIVSFAVGDAARLTISKK
jgi:hypothetical protein